MREQLGAAVGCNGRAETSDILQTANIQYSIPGMYFCWRISCREGGMRRERDVLPKRVWGKRRL